MVTTKDDLVARLKEKIMASENPTDDEIKFMEDLSDTFDSFSANNSDDLNAKINELESKNKEWEQKYNDNESAWKKKYIERFEGKVTDIPEVKESLDAERGANISIDDLFIPKN